MTKEVRRQEIELIEEWTKAQSDEGKTHKLIRWRDENKSMLVCKIPLRLLIYNKYNGRILSRTKSLEQHGNSISPETPEGKATIERLLWESKENRNKITMNDLEEKGQLQIGIVTKDGVIIDGNRRAMLLNKLGKDYFLAVVLPVEQDEDPLEIQKLETEYQMGEDKKLDYNPIEKYLRAGELYQKLSQDLSRKDAISKIAKWMGERPTEISEYLDVLDTIDDYLKYLEYDGIYAMADTPNDGKEDLFIQLTGWIKTFKNKESGKAFDGYNDMDVEFLKIVSFDYIRAKIGKSSYDGKIFRYIANGRKENHFFGDKKIWKDFLQNHRDNIFPLIEKIDNDIPVQGYSADPEKYLSDRDTKFKNEAIDYLVKNINNHIEYLGYKQAANEPKKLASSARKALDTININHDASKEQDVLREIQGIHEKTRKMLSASSEKMLSLVVDVLNEVADKGFDGEDDKETIIKKVKEISKISFDMKKELGR